MILPAIPAMPAAPAATPLMLLTSSLGRLLALGGFRRRCLCACATAASTSTASAFSTRRATPTDLDGLRRLQPEAHGGLDDLPDLLPLLTSPEACTAAATAGGIPRRAYVSCDGDGASGVPAAFLTALLVDAGRTAVFSHGRAREDLVGSGALARLAAAALVDLGGGVGRTIGALCMPRYTREGIANCADAFAVLLSLGQLGFHFNALYNRAELAPRLVASASAGVSDVSTAQLWRALSGRPEAAGRLFPGGHLLVGRVPMRLTEANLLMAGSDPSLSAAGAALPSLSLGDGGGDPTGVSFLCQRRVRLGRHLTVTAYADTEATVLSHLRHQLRRAVAEDDDDDDDDIYLSVFFPPTLSIPSLLNLLRDDPALRNLPLSSNPKLNCKLHAVQHLRRAAADGAGDGGPPGDLACPKHAIPDDVTNID